MTTAELIERLTALVKEQADIIRILADALSQLGEVADLECDIKSTEREYLDILRE